MQWKVAMSGNKKKLFKKMSELESKHVTFTINIVRLTPDTPEELSRRQFFTRSISNTINDGLTLNCIYPVLQKLIMEPRL